MLRTQQTLLLRDVRKQEAQGTDLALPIDFLLLQR